MAFYATSLTWSVYLLTLKATRNVVQGTAAKSGSRNFDFGGDELLLNQHEATDAARGQPFYV